MGKNTGISPEEIKANAKKSMENNAVESGKASSRFDVNLNSDMSSVMRRSDAEKEPVKLIDDDEHIKNRQEIKEVFLQKAHDFTDILTAMGTATPGGEGKVMFEDFFKAVIHFCGNDRFSSFQVKWVFKEIARFLPGSDNIDKAYIPINAFKDMFYPGKVVQSDIMTQVE